MTLNELGDRYERVFGQSYPRRTFNNHREAVESLFGILIGCRRGSNSYFIEYGGEALDRDRSRDWLINTFTVKSLLTLSKERLSGRVSVEDIPSGQLRLTQAMEAMVQGRELLIRYKKYSAAKEEAFHIQPLALKEHERRWYLMAYCRERAQEYRPRSAAWRVYALDRISSMEDGGRSFKVPKKFDVDEVFAPSFGIYLPEEGQKAVSVLFKATEAEAAYIRDLPLHRSQTEIRPGVFRIRVIPNRNLVLEFCAHGAGLEVLGPPEFREQVAAELDKAAALYSAAVPEKESE